MTQPVVIIVSFMNVAGAQQAALRVAEGLRERGDTVEVWFLYREAPHPAETRPWVRVLDPSHRPGALGYLRIAIRLWRMLRTHRPRAVISFLPLANVLGQMVAAMTAIPVRIASARGPLEHYGTILRWGDRVMARLGIYSKIMTVSNAVAAGYDFLPPRLSNRVKTVHNGTELFECPVTVAEAREQLLLPHDAFLVLSTGRFKPQKNYGFQVEIAARLRDAVIVVAGDGPERDSIQNRAERDASGRMIFLGNLDRDQMRLLYRAADMFIQPSHYEGQSNALLEAMQAGLPILSADNSAQRETLCQGAESAGILLSLDDPARWAQTIARLQKGRAERDAWGVRARQRASVFTVHAQIDGVQSMLGHSSKSTAKLTLSSADCA